MAAPTQRLHEDQERRGKNAEERAVQSQRPPQQYTGLSAK